MLLVETLAKKVLEKAQEGEAKWEVVLRVDNQEPCNYRLQVASQKGAQIFATSPSTAFGRLKLVDWNRLRSPVCTYCSSQGLCNQGEDFHKWPREQDIQSSAHTVSRSHGIWNTLLPTTELGSSCCHWCSHSPQEAASYTWFLNKDIATWGGETGNLEHKSLISQVGKVPR